MARTIKEVFFYILLVSLGLLAGWFVFSTTEKHSHGAQSVAQEYTCSMHPQIRMQDKSAKCPLCGMDLIPVVLGATTDDSGFEMSAEAIALAKVETVEAKKSEPQKMLRLYGNIQANERNIHSQTAHISGRLEKLFVNFEGETVRKGQIIASIYSSELLSIQTEFLEALKQKHPVITEAAKERLRLLKITENQIEDLERTGKANPHINIVADASGIVTARRTARGEYVEAGSALFDVANLSSVWAIFNAYESDLPYLNVGDLIGYTINALPGQVFTGRVEFISPIVDSESRTAKVRMETDNKNLKLKPGMLANALIHNAKISGEAIILPKSAVLWTGERSVVYTVKKHENGALNFHLREVKLGPALGDSVVVLSGIHEKELVAVSGVFAVDASAQLAGKNSMMNLSPYPQGDTMSKITNLAAIALICTSAVACDEHKAHTSAQPAKTQNVEGVVRLGVAGSCEMCKMRIEGVVKSQSGVKSADWDIKTQTLRIEIEPSKANLNDISKAIAAAGHDTEKDKADDTTYNALPGCCKYRK